MECTVRFSRVSKRFRLGRTHPSLRGRLAALFSRTPKETPERILKAVDDLDFRVNQGEALGIIGPNGAGKSTVLKLLAGILRPDEGDVGVRGRVTALIEVGAGFHPDLTGRENVYLNGAILGMSRPEVRRKMDAIVAFAGIARFLDEPVKRYSSGMYARLGFSIAAHVDPDVLLVDEVLSVGDAVFRLRCLERMRELLTHGTSLVFVTHNLDQMQAICSRALTLERGRCVFDGGSREAVGHYLTALSRSYAARPTDVSNDDADGTISDVDLRFMGSDGREVVWVQCETPLEARLRFRLRRPVQRLAAELNLRASPEENLLSFNSARVGRTWKTDPGEHLIRLRLPGIPLAGGQYFWNVRIWDVHAGVTLVDTPLWYPMVIDDGGRGTGRLTIGHEWQWHGEPMGDDPASHSTAYTEHPSRPLPAAACSS